MKKNLVKAIITCFIFVSCGIQTEETKPIKRDIVETVFASGTLEAEGSYNLTARTDGYLTNLKFKENELVKKGQILAIIDNKQNTINEESSDLLYRLSITNSLPDSPMKKQAEYEVQKTKQKLDYSFTLLNRYKKMLEAKSITNAEYEQIEIQYKTCEVDYQNAIQNFNLVEQQIKQQLVSDRTQRDLSNILSNYNQVYAFYPGRVLKKYKELGDFVRQGDIIALIGDTENTYAKVSIDEGSIKKVRIGQKVVIQLNTDKTNSYEGKVIDILPTFDEATQSFICKISFTSKFDFKIIGTQLQVNINVGETKNALLIPKKFFGYNNEVQIKGESKPKKIKTKIVSSDWVQVLSGLDENTILITNNPK